MTRDPDEQDTASTSSSADASNSAPREDLGASTLADLGHGRPRRRQRRCGIALEWCYGIAGWTVMVLMVLVVNLGIILGIGIRYGYTDGSSLLRQGDCVRIGSNSAHAHVFINALSVTLLSASFYCMQCLTVPSRQDINIAHRQGVTLEVGVANLRNSPHIARWKVVVWLLLAISSTPLHLCYNSVVSSSLATREYAVYSVNEAFVSTPTLNIPQLLKASHPESLMYSNHAPVLTKLHANAFAGTLIRLNNLECINAYGTTSRASRRSNLLLVSQSPYQTATVLNYTMNLMPHLLRSRSCSPDPVPWMCPHVQCGRPCSSLVQGLVNGAAIWSPLGHQVQYCLSERVDQICQLRFSLPLALTVIMFNLLEAGLMLLVIAYSRDLRLDAIRNVIRSLLTQPEPVTRLVEPIHDFEGSHGFVIPQHGVVFEKERARSSQALGKSGWCLVILLYFVGILICICVLSFGMSTSNAQGNVGLPYIWNLRPGTVAVDTVTFWSNPTSGFVGYLINMLITSIPHLIFSVAYFVYNAFFTTMLAAYQWSVIMYQSYGPQEQRAARPSTCSSQLPYSLAIPLLVICGTMHWIVSQSLFLVGVLHYTPNAPLMSLTDDCDGSENGVSCVSAGDMRFARDSCGWSPLTLGWIILIGCLIISMVFVIALRRRMLPGTTFNEMWSAILGAAGSPVEEHATGEKRERSQVQHGDIGEAAKHNASL